jgi:hypothetical protein
MKSHHAHRFSIAIMAVLLVALIGSTTARAADEFIPGVTDSTTGVMAELGEPAYIPGVTDSSTGVLRELERKGLEPRAVSLTNAGESGFGDDTAVAVGAALAAVFAAVASAALFAAARRRRVAI